MSDVITLTNRGQVAIYGALAGPPIEPPMLTSDELFDTLDYLPGYAEFYIEVMSGGAMRVERFKLMARDMPRKGRRYTCLTTGFEWFDLRDLAKRGEWAAVAIFNKDETIVGSALID